jgi:hypothetical protein
MGFTGGLFYCCRAGLPRSLNACETSAVFLLCLPLAIGSLNNAQSNPLVLGLLLIAAAAVVKRRWAISTIAVTLATCFKLYPIAFGLLLLLIYPRRIGWRLLVCLTAAAVLPFILQHADYVMDQYSIWVRYLSTEDRQRGPITDWYRDFRALWRIYVLPMRQTTYLIIELVSAALIALTVLIARVRKMPVHFLVAFTLSLACCWMTVLGPATESPTYILVAPAIAWGIVLSEEEDARPVSAVRFRRIAYATVFGIFVVSQIALNVHTYGKRFRDRLQPLPFAGSILMVVIWGEIIAWKRESNDDDRRKFNIEHSTSN